MINYTKQERQIEKLRQYGFQLALDDYGSGFSNLSQVKKVSFSSIKLDMSIVWDYYDKRDILLPSMVQTFKAMGFRITAEGIETEDMAEVMSRIAAPMIGGMLTAPLLSMLVLPAAYLLLHRPKSKPVS